MCQKISFFSCQFKMDSKQTYPRGVSWFSLVQWETMGSAGLVFPGSTVPSRARPAGWCRWVVTAFCADLPLPKSCAERPCKGWVFAHRPSASLPGPGTRLSVKGLLPVITVRRRHPGGHVHTLQEGAAWAQTNLAGEPQVMLAYLSEWWR